MPAGPSASSTRYSVPPPARPALPTASLQASDAYRGANLLYLRNTSIGNILDLCGVSVPCGWTSAGLPIGLMIYGRSFDEASVLRIARAYERSTDWHERHPDLSWIA